MSSSNDSVSDTSESESEIVNRKRDTEINAILNIEHSFWRKFSQFFVDNNLVMKCLEETASLINSVPFSTYKVPTSKYLILQKLQKETFPIYFWIHCDACKKYECHETGRNKFFCSSCNAGWSTKINKFFIAISTVPQLRKILIENWDAIVEYQCRNKEHGIISDVSCGFISMNIVQNNPFNLKLTLTFNTDGVQVFKSTTKSLWPIQFICNFLPPDIRFHQKNIIVSGLSFEHGKPNMLSFFEPIALEFNDIHENGISVLINGQSIKLKVNITHCSVDLPAQSMVQGIVLYNGYNSCPQCMHYGVSIKNEKNNKQFVRFIWRGVIEEPRTHAGMLLDMKFADQKVNCMFIFFFYWHCSLFGFTMMH